MFVCCCENWDLALQCQIDVQKMIAQKRSLRALPAVVKKLLHYLHVCHAALRSGERPVNTDAAV